MPVESERAHVLIAGAGFAGLALAIALRQGLGPAFGVTIADPALGRTKSDTRATAIAAGARRLLKTLGVWPQIDELAEPIVDMAVTDSRLDDAVRPVFLTFSGEVEPGEPFAHMVENGPLLATLLSKAEAEGVRLMPTAVGDFSVHPAGIAVRLPGADVVHADLLVAADGARSRLRDLAGIQCVSWTYGQSAISMSIAHEREHGGRAEEHFLPAGPFAVLPLTGRRSSIVWVEESAEAERIVAASDDEFLVELERRFGLRLGELALAGPRRTYPLGFSLSRAFVAERLALVGDAAHIIHPIAGQGLNMGLRDIAALAEVVVDAARLGLDPGRADVLARYQRWRRFDNLAMGIATDGLNRLFSNRSDILRLARDIGLGLVDRLPALKQMFIREAAGFIGDVPKLLRGEQP